MDINKAIIHTLDDDLKSMILSQQPLNLNNQHAIENYLLKLVKGMQNSTSTTRATIGDRSPFKALIGTQFPFLETTQDLARQWFEQYIQNMDYTSNNLVFVLADLGESVGFGMFELLSKDGVIKITQNVQGVENALVYNHAIMPSGFASVQAGFLIDLTSGDTRVKAVPANRDAIETFLDTTLIANSKQSFQVVDTLIQSISDQRDVDRLPNTIKARQIITDNVELYDEIEPEQILKEIFEDIDEHEASLIHNAFEANNVTDLINLKLMNKTATIKKHRIRTESGIEIILPLDILDVQNIIDIKTDINGRVSIELKDIGKIVEE
ncbi:nucleoid-associated protein [Erysipelothrix aquatica]|uniref:nucleoid-associated protein n=1 Tax=Erysipelothrix aquatica TaxID=2683714 RepID=UPI00135ABD70|nr:nucleoid-associated protein [Erysipelothrix aquatica]